MFSFGCAIFSSLFISNPPVVPSSHQTSNLEAFWRSYDSPKERSHDTYWRLRKVREENQFVGGKRALKTWQTSAICFHMGHPSLFLLPLP